MRWSRSVKTEQAMIAFHGGAVLLSLVAAMVWPRAGQAALMVPLGDRDLGTVLRWADSEQAQVLELDTATGRVIARVSSHHVLVSALASGIMPVAVSARGCGAGETP